MQLLICGAEPIRPEVMNSFFGYFGKCGVQPTTLMPAYGLAEYTLCATAQPPFRPLDVLYVDGPTLMATGRVELVEESHHGSSAYVGVGMGQGDTMVRIVHPESMECQGEGRVGEIWLDGSCKGAGYYDNEQNTKESFGGMIRGEEASGRTYLRTGDQGFLYRGVLYITGRIKDLIIIRGRNLYPQVKKPPPYPPFHDIPRIDEYH